MPGAKGLRLTGLCQPARTVSGDYYDYLAAGPGRIAIAIGDVAGKGISAALVMAALQSSLRAQLQASLEQVSSSVSAAVGAGSNAGGAARISTAGVLERINRQLY